MRYTQESIWLLFTHTHKHSNHAASKSNNSRLKHTTTRHRERMLVSLCCWLRLNRAYTICMRSRLHLRICSQLAHVPPLRVCISRVRARSCVMIKIRSDEHRTHTIHANRYSGILQIVNHFWFRWIDQFHIPCLLKCLCGCLSLKCFYWDELLFIFFDCENNSSIFFILQL
jgi:hypothetical protein